MLGVVGEKERLGARRVGLRTGDAAVQLEAEVVVMTTEILRNMLYNADDERWAQVRTPPSLGRTAAIATPPSPCRYS